MEMDPSDFEPSGFLKPSRAAASASSSSAAAASLIDPALIPGSSQHQHQYQQQYASAAELAKFKGYQCIYPVYFDKNRSRAEGRRVGRKLAVENPLARDIVDAVQVLGLETLFEPDKQHPKDWANPGRVKVLVKQKGRLANPRLVKNKHHLFIHIATHLQAHPTTEASARRLRVASLPPPDPDKPVPAPAVPRGWKMGSILPLHSAALSGGGVSENMLKDMMMAGMPGLDPGGSTGTGPANLFDSAADGPPRKKKDKKKAKA